MQKMPKLNEASIAVKISGIDSAIGKAKELNSLLEQAKKLSSEITSQTGGFHVSVE